MKMVFKLMVILSLILCSYDAEACRLNPKHEYISLSGPVTMLLEELGVLKDPSLRAISTLHPTKAKTSATKLAGGLFLSSRSLKSFAGKVVFIDASKELEDNIKQYPVKQLIVIGTRGMGALAVTGANLKVLGPFLQNCHQQEQKLKLAMERMRKLLKNYAFTTKTALFYVGKITKDNFPALIMAADGPVLDLNQAGAQTYSSELAYVSWSEKVVRSLGSQALHLGLVEGPEDELAVEKISPDKINLQMRGVLTPGISQLRFLEKFLQQKILAEGAK